MKHWFLPETPDLLAALRKHAEITREGIDALAAWSGGDSQAHHAVVDAEHRADEAKREVQRGLRIAFSTPLDPEDIYELSERIDAVMNAAKNIVREAEVMAMSPNAQMATMAGQLARGQAQLVTAVGALDRDADRATAASDDAVRACRDVERSYRQAMSELLEVADLREVMGRRELYRRYARAADAVEAASGRVWYAVVKSP